MTENEIKFCEYYFNTMVAKNLRHISGDELREAATIIGVKPETQCPSCMRNTLLELNNIYGTLSPHWEKYKQDELTKKNEAEKLATAAKEKKLKNLKQFKVAYDPDADILFL